MEKTLMAETPDIEVQKDFKMLVEYCKNNGYLTNDKETPLTHQEIALSNRIEELFYEIASYSGSLDNIIRTKKSENSNCIDTYYAIAYEKKVYEFHYFESTLPRTSETQTVIYFVEVGDTKDYPEEYIAFPNEPTVRSARKKRF